MKHKNTGSDLIQDITVPFKIVSDFKPSGDQPKAIDQLIKNIHKGENEQVLLGVTGSGKTFTMAKVIEKLQRPTLIMAPNKTLAAQLYGEMNSLFPNNAVEYFVSYYDAYKKIPVFDWTVLFFSKRLGELGVESAYRCRCEFQLLQCARFR